MPRHIAINSTTTLVPLLPTTHVRIRPRLLDWSVFVHGWANGAIPSAYWVPTELQIVHDGLALKLEDKADKTVRVTSLVGWFEERIAELLLVAWRGDEGMVQGARARWVRDFAEVCASAVAVEVPGGRV
ncbi:uncharacterized protein BKCO1_9800017 [Diplodia corticola]|uniref:Uncharacterized protein n=1 Tax=Diplodia corticola TaxID=236234 RepID=A0A1J9QKL0_9PEZI|nr:uncharacterized protein BKCO1_9800017 [Diplodia corticola]OJD29009.1 hypothetical protein BKCO1_9800017 [Diplodia corticola]